MVSFLESTQYTPEGSKQSCRNVWVAFVNERGPEVRWNLRIIAHLRTASRLDVDCHDELGVYQWIGPLVVCEGWLTPRLFLARSMIECLDHVRSVIFRFKKGGKLRMVLLNQFTGTLPYSSSFVNDLVNLHDGRLQSSPDGLDRFHFRLRPFLSLPISSWCLSQ